MFFRFSRRRLESVCVCVCVCVCVFVCLPPETRPDAQAFEVRTKDDEALSVRACFTYFTNIRGLKLTLREHGPYASTRLFKVHGREVLPELEACRTAAADPDNLPLGVPVAATRRGRRCRPAGASSCRRSERRRPARSAGGGRCRCRRGCRGARGA